MKFSKEELEMLREGDRIMEEVNKDPDIKNVQAPEEIYDKLQQMIRNYENAVSYQYVPKEDKELIRLEKLYKRSRRWNRILILAAALVLVLGVCMTSMGGTQKVFEMVKRTILGREQIQVDSKEIVKADDDLNEEETYEKIEDKFGFYPIRLDYLPEGISFLEARIDEEIQRIYMFYGEDKDVKISYFICPGYRESSWGKDVEDKLIEKFELNNGSTVIQVGKYLIENDTIRWMIRFQYNDVSYSVYINDMEKEEVEKIINNLYLY